MTDTDQHNDMVWSAKLRELYSGAIADILDELGYRDQHLPHDVRPLDPTLKLAGPAFTVRGRTRAVDASSDPRYKQLEMLEAIRAPAVVLIDGGDETEAAHWGELMSSVARAQGATGAVVYGGLRDSDFILKMGFPVFRRFHSPLTAVWRFEQIDYQVPVKIAGVRINPGDYLFGDIDGVVVIPRGLVPEVLARAEDVVGKERVVFDKLNEGRSMRSLFEEYKVF